MSYPTTGTPCAYARATKVTLFSENTKYQHFICGVLFQQQKPLPKQGPWNESDRRSRHDAADSGNSRNRGYFLRTSCLGLLSGVSGLSSCNSSSSTPATVMPVNFPSV